MKTKLKSKKPGGRILNHSTANPQQIVTPMNVQAFFPIELVCAYRYAQHPMPISMSAN